MILLIVLLLLMLAVEGVVDRKRTIPLIGVLLKLNPLVKFTTTTPFF